MGVFFLFYEQKNVLRKQRHWERQLAAKKSKRKEEKQKRRLNRAQASGEDRGESTNAEDHNLIRRLLMILCSVHKGGDKEAAQLTKRVMKAITNERLAEARSTGQKLCVDLSMTDCMSDKVMIFCPESNPAEAESIAFTVVKKFTLRSINIK